jgi:hypothetical protein
MQFYHSHFYWKQTMKINQFIIHLFSLSNGQQIYFPNINTLFIKNWFKFPIFMQDIVWLMIRYLLVLHYLYTVHYSEYDKNEQHMVI